MDKTALRTAAEKYGTPLYLFDLEAFTARAQRVRAAFGSDVNLCYSMKANPFVLRGLPDVFRWVEVCSPGELTICEKLGIPPEQKLRKTWISWVWDWLNWLKKTRHSVFRLTKKLVRQ